MHKVTSKHKKMSWACDQTVIPNIVDSYQTAGSLFALTLQSFFAAQCALVGDHLWPADVTEEVLKDPNYDFIVLGAGAAGAVVANRLSENPEWKVLLVEAGGNPKLSTEIPPLFYSNLGTSVDWDHYSQPQEGACRSYKRKGCAWPQGKVMGGSSSINGMYYVRGNKADYDGWAASGNSGWSFEEVLPYFIKIENFTGDITEENQKYHGRNGPVNIVQETEPTPEEDIIIQAATELGIKHLNEINGADQMGTTVTANNIKGNYRVSTARAYLSPIRQRKNLHVMQHAYAIQILFTPGTNSVSGVLINKDGKNITVNAKKEVITSCGAVKSPQLLMLSGLGPKEHLEEMGIDVIADLPIGKNLQDHAYAPIFYSKLDVENSITLSAVTQSLADYMLKGSGLFKDTRSNRVITFINTTDPTSSVPDIQFHHLVLPPSSSDLVDIYYKHGLSEEFHEKFLKINKEKTVITSYSVLLHPKSKGNITLASKNPFDKPLIFANYFEDPEDMERIISSMKQYSLNLGKSKSFLNAGFEIEWVELEACKEYVKASDEHLECIIRELTFSLYHPTSTVKMGPENDPTAVVDNELRVRKVTGLRVIDASIMPSIISGNTNAPSIMIGEKGADLIKQSWL
ncbi:unnamed protein product [Arctia plantaginis]|uniref:Glucose-methanol-choline oxidoreductase N-terminal domain-containing protein n=1 Tax=Arctia plantaginis TaxID=874455 RepID=A0A8S0YND5_ARCPL|nr:unnamed protein product [Arctia plantaginis]